MKKIISIICTCLLLSSNAYALFGAGDIVSDPTSYTYYVEQIKQATEQLETLQEQLEQAQAIYEETMDMKNQLMGAYDHAVGMVEEIKGIQEEIENNPSAMLKYAEKFLKYEGKDDEYMDPRVILEGAFKDPRIPKDKTEEYKILNQKYHARQKTLEEAIVQAEKTLNKMPQRYKLLEDLAGRIDGTPNVKAAMDLNNRILAEILKVLTDHLALAAYIGEAQNMINFEGVDTAQTEQLAKDIEANKQASENYVPLQDFHEKHGIDLENQNHDELKKMMKWD